MIAAFADNLRTEFGLESAMVIHRVGRMLPGEAIVLAAAASVHRKAAIAALDRLMDWLKLEAPFWKLEETGNIRRWIEPGSTDPAGDRVSF